jgi:SSS family solute:Na+ symporter
LTCSALVVAISIAKPHLHTAESEKLVWTSLAEALQGTGARGLRDYRVAAALLVAAMTALYIIFA